MVDKKVSLFFFSPYFLYSVQQLRLYPRKDVVLILPVLDKRQNVP
jgi:hypothetical protein